MAHGSSLIPSYSGPGSYTNWPTLDRADRLTPPFTGRSRDFVLTPSGELIMWPGPVALGLPIDRNEMYSVRRTALAKPEWGTKRSCPSCGARFYDLGRSPVTCPACEAEVPTEPLLKGRRSSTSDKSSAKSEKAAAAAKPKAAEAPTKEVGVEEVDSEENVEIEENDDDDSGDDVLETAGDFVEDDEVPDISDRVENDEDKE